MTRTISIGLLLAGTLVAQAKPTPEIDVAPRLTPTSEDTAVLVGPAGAMLESDYFRAPRPDNSDSRRPFPCRLQLSVFDKARLATSCR